MTAPVDEKLVNWVIALIALLCLAVATVMICENAARATHEDFYQKLSAQSDETAIGDGELRERFRSGLLFRKQPNGDSEVLFDGSITQAIRWTAIAICMTVGGSVMIVFASLLRPFLKRD